MTPTESARSETALIRRHPLHALEHELNCLPFSQSGGQVLFHLISKLYENTSLLITTNLALRRFPTKITREN
jgi:hypothetical protein